MLPFANGNKADRKRYGCSWHVPSDFVERDGDVAPIIA